MFFAGDFARFRAQALKFIVQRVEFLVAQIFQINQMISRALYAADQFVELQMHGAGVAVLCILNEKNHQERDDCRKRIDYQLPGVKRIPQFVTERPGDDQQNGEDECPG